jgi:hypothetical protein
MKYLQEARAVLRLVRRSQTAYGAAMKFIDRIKRRIQLVVTIVIVWALVMLGLAIYIAIRVS